ncbi:MAG: oligosaccharide flippase family protein [Proteobacteria bacterium]|nr:oligosaccharide flippase family protein [Pseudomonadota bacterium]
MSDVTKTAKFAAIYAIGTVIEKAASFIMLPIYTRYLTPADYGTIELLVMTVDIFSFLAGAGLAQAVFRFYYRYDDPKDRNRVVSTAGILLVSFFFVASIIGIASSNPLAALILEGKEQEGLYFRLIFIVFFLQAFLSIPMLFIQAQQRPVLFVIVSVSKLLMQLSLNIYFVVFCEMHVLGVLYSLLITWSVFTVVLLFYTVKNAGVQFSFSLAKELLIFGYPVIIANLGAFIITFSDRYFIKAFAGLSAVGVYSLGYKFGFILGVIAVQPIYKIWEPKRFEVAKQKDVQEINQKVFFFFNLVLVSFALGIALFCNDLLRIMSDPKFWNASTIVPLIMVAYIIQAWTDFNNFGIYHSGKTKYLAIATVASVITIIAFSFILIPTYKGIGAAIATVIAFTVRFVVVFYYSQKQFRLDLWWGRSLAMLGAAAIVYILSLFMTFEGIMASIGAHVGLFLLFLVLLFALPVFSKQNKRVVFQLVRHPIATIKSRGVR